MRGLLADADCTGHAQRLHDLLSSRWRAELWRGLGIELITFEQLGLARDATDREVWERCHAESLVLLTANRNSDGPDALECVIAELDDPAVLPVITLADPDRIMTDREYAGRVAEQLLQYLFDIDALRGTRRLYIP